VNTGGERWLSILIPTLESRRSECARLCEQIHQQIRFARACDTVELLTLRDSGAAAIGSKRNRLIAMASGRFVVFVDDDDTVSDEYVERLLEAIREHPDVDCVCISGEIDFRGSHRRKMIHSIRFGDWGYNGESYSRPPCHITPIRREIAQRYPFAEVNYGEDMEWSMRINRDRALEKEIVLDRVLYFYHSRRHYAIQWLLDRSQAVRHALGLRFVTGLDLRRKLRSTRSR